MSPTTFTRRVEESDAELLAAVQTGSVAAFSVLYDRYCDRAYRVAWSVCLEDGRARDAVEATFLRIWNGDAGDPSPQSSVAGWLLASVHRRASDLCAYRAPSSSGESSVGSELDDPAGPADAGRLRASVAGLPEVERAAIVLAVYGRLTHAEIAAEFGLSAAAVKGCMRLGMQQLRTRVDGAGS